MRKGSDGLLLETCLPDLKVRLQKALEQERRKVSGLELALNAIRYLEEYVSYTGVSYSGIDRDSLIPSEILRYLPSYSFDGTSEDRFEPLLFSARLNYYMTVDGYSDSQVALILDVSAVTVSSWRSGRSIPTKGSIVSGLSSRLAKLFGNPFGSEFWSKSIERERVARRMFSNGGKADGC